VSEPAEPWGDDDHAWVHALRRLTYRVNDRYRWLLTAREQDARDFRIMLYAQRHPRIAASNVPTGEMVDFGARPFACR
jgi:hypothetical protein